ncbi:MAG TPA: porin [Azospirillum sp.]|nr:porin [Azospirillum sp.]
MNRYLLAGCAAVALAMGSGAANAQAKFEVKVGGDVFAEWGWVDNDLDTGLRSTEMRNRFRFNLIPSAKADNGLEYGARIRVRADSSNSGAANNDTNVSRLLNQDRAYIFAQGGFGQVRVGTSNTYNDETIVSRPIDYLPFGLFDQFNGFANTATNGLTGLSQSNNLGQGSATWPTFGDVATRIVYFSPRIAGFQLGASYTPRTDDSQNSVNRSEFASGITAADTVTDSFQDLLEVGANYDATFGSVKVKVGAGYYWGDASDVAGANYRDMRAWQAGAQVGFAGATIGASYTDWGKSGTRRSAVDFGDRANVWNVGAQYTVGPIVVGGGWMFAKDSGEVTLPGKREINVYEIGASYTVAPGFAVQAQYDYFDIENETGRTAFDDKGSVVILRTTLAF